MLLTDGELDHTLGLLLLREANELEVHATAAVHETLCNGTSLLQTLGAYASVEWRPVLRGQRYRWRTVCPGFPRSHEQAGAFRDGDERPLWAIESPMDTPAGHWCMCRAHRFDGIGASSPGGLYVPAL